MPLGYFFLMAAHKIQPLHTNIIMLINRMASKSGAALDLSCPSTICYSHGASEFVKVQYLENEFKEFDQILYLHQQ